MKKLFSVFVFVFCVVGSVHAYVVSTVSAGCRPSTRMNAVFEVNTYNCSEGYYLPANAEGCQACIAGYTCPGGSFQFNENFAQGIVFDTLISNNISGGCNKETLSAHGEQAVLNARFEPNTIALHWYNGNDELTVPAASQSCMYDGTLTPPATIPTKTGYTFKGWRVKQADTSCFASQVCGLNGSAVSGLTYDNNDSTAFGYYSNDGQYKQNESTYGLTAGGWAVKDTSGGIVKGIASCNSTMPTIMETIMTAMGNGTMTQEQAQAAIYGSCASDAIKPGNTFSSSSSGQYCWCKMNSYTPSGGSACNVASPSWVFGYDIGSASYCATLCASYCAGYVVGIADFRRALFGVSQ